MGTSPVGGDSTNGQIANQLNSVIRDVQAQQTVQVFKDDTGTRRVILDKDGLRTSPAGLDVYDATNSQLTFNSNQNALKVVLSDTIILPATAATATPFWNQTSTIQLIHNLGYKPAVLAFEDSGGNLQPFVPGTIISAYNPTTGAPSAFSTITINITSQAVNFTVNYYDRGGNANIAIPLKVYLLQETATQ